jgi:hypothetical protein
MIVTVIRILIGFAIACLAAAAVLVSFVMTTDLVTDDLDKLGSVGMLVLLAATHTALFSAPFAVIGAVVGEWQAIRGWAYYGLAGLAIAIAGFIAQYSSEAAGQPTIVNSYALAAFLTSGVVGGLIYWLLSGRYAGNLMYSDDPTGTPPETGKKSSQPQQAIAEVTLKKA